MPLPSDLDLWRSAGIMVRQHGSRAPTAAADRAKRMEASGDKEEAMRELARLIATGMSDDFTRRAKEKLKK